MGRQVGQRRERAVEGEGSGAQARWARAREAVAASAWAALGGKAAAYVAGFCALALVGSGHLLGLVPGGGGGSRAEAGLVAPPAGPAQAEAPAHGGAGAEADAGAPPADAGAADDAGGGGVTADGKVVLNRATAEDLRRLPGVGPSKAAAILALRAKLGRFRKVDDLMRVKGIGRRSLNRLRPLVVVDPP